MLNIGGLILSSKQVYDAIARAQPIKPLAQSQRLVGIAYRGRVLVDQP